MMAAGSGALFTTVYVAVQGKRLLFSVFCEVNL